MSLLEQNTVRKGRVDKNNTAELDAGNNESGEYKVKAICDSAVYAKESESSHLLGLYYLVFWKRYLEEENTWESALAIQHLRKLISLFHKNYPDKPTMIFEAINTTLPMAQPTIKPIVKPFLVILIKKSML